MSEVNVEEVDLIVKNLKELRDKKSALTEELKGVNEEFDRVKQDLISIMVDIGKKSWSVEGVGTASISTRTFWNIKDQKKLREYFMESGNEDMIKISSQAITSYFNEMQELHEDSPEQYEEKFGVSYYPQLNISLRK